MKVKVILILVVIGLNIKSQTIDQIVGYVYDDKSFNPIENVQVYIENLGIGTFTDRNGYFSLNGISQGRYKVIFKHVAYNERSVIVNVYADKRISLKVYLEPKMIELEPVYKISPSYPSLFSISEQVKIIKNDGRAKNLEELLTKDSRILLRRDTYGNTVIQISGSSQEDVVLMIDGNPISDTKKGYINSDVIPVDMIECVEIIQGSVSAIAGNSAIGGVINIITRQKSEDFFEFNISKGTFGYNKQFFSISKNFENIGVVLGAGQEFCKNDFPYRDIYGEIISRKGNEYLKNRLIFKLKSPAKKDINIDLMAIFEKSNFGVPGNIYNPTIGTKNKNENTIFSINVGNISNKLKFLYNQFNNSYTSPRSIFGRINTTYKIESTNLELSRKYNFKSVDINLTSGLRYERMFSEDLVRPSLSMGSKKRCIFYSSVNTELNYQMGNSIISFSLPLRIDYASDYKENFSLYFESSYKKYIESVNLKFVVGYGSSFKLPTFNQLYWIGDIYSQGNPDLKPEKGRGLSVSGSIDFKILILPCHFEISYLNNNVRDVIIWRRAWSNKYIPVNNDIAKIENLSSHLNIKLDQRLNVYSGFSINNAINKTRQPNLYGKYLPYRPLSQGDLTLEFIFNKFYFNIVSQYFGKNYVTEANTVYLNSYWLLNLNMGYMIKVFKKYKLDINIGVNNVLDTEYYMLEYYPMPGRQITLAISIGGSERSVTWKR